MIALLLASTIAASIPSAVDRTLAAQEGQHDAFQDQRIAELERKLKRVEEIADEATTCVSSAFVFAGADLYSTALGIKYCEQCAESNPAGFNAEARIALKIGILGTQIFECYHRAKSEKGGTGKLTWFLRGIQGLAVINNTVSAIKGTPLISWGTPKEPEAPVLIGGRAKPSAGLPLLKVRF